MFSLVSTALMFLHVSTSKLLTTFLRGRSYSFCKRKGFLLNLQLLTLLNLKRDICEIPTLNWPIKKKKKRRRLIEVSVRVVQGVCSPRNTFANYSVRVISQSPLVVFPFILLTVYR